MPHSWQVLSMSAGLRASMQQKMGLARSVSQHGSDAGLGVGAVYTVGALLGHGCRDTHTRLPAPVRFRKKIK